MYTPKERQIMSPQAGFILQDQVVPRLKAAIPRAVLTIGSEDHEELIQDATCLAANSVRQTAQDDRCRCSRSVGL